MKAYLKMHTHTAKALLPLSELAGQNTKLNLRILQETAGSKLNLDTSYSRQLNPEVGNSMLIGGGR
jgi:hypothetical protein